jgi:hypothetical protein
LFGQFLDGSGAREFSEEIDRAGRSIQGRKRQTREPIMLIFGNDDWGTFVHFLGHGLPPRGQRLRVVDLID